MPANIDSKEMFKQKEVEETSHADYSLIGLAEQSEIEIKWVQLHQMFDR